MYRGGSRIKYLGGLAPRPVSRNVVWGLWGVRVPKALEWRRPRRRQGWGLGRGYVGVGSGEGAVPNLGIFSFEMVHFDAFWSTF